MNTPSPGRIPLARLRGQKIQQPFGPLTTAAIRAAFGMIDLHPRNRLNMVWHLVRHRGLFIDLHNTRNRKPVLRCTCGTLLADQAGTVK